MTYEVVNPVTGNTISAWPSLLLARRAAESTGCVIVTFNERGEATAVENPNLGIACAGDLREVGRK